MYYLMYVSSAQASLSSDELEALLAKARDKNKRLGITGMLIHRGGNFIQYIEGEYDQVQKLYASICEDSRHFGAIVIAEDKIENRQFGDWAMDLRVAGIKPIFSSAELANDPEGVKKLLNAFVSNMR